MHCREGFRYRVIIHRDFAARHCLRCVRVHRGSQLAAPRPATFCTAVCTGVARSLAAATAAKESHARMLCCVPARTPLVGWLSHVKGRPISASTWVTRGTCPASPRGTRPPARGCSTRCPGPALPPAAACAPAPAPARPRAAACPPAGLTAQFLRLLRAGPGLRFWQACLPLKWLSACNKQALDRGQHAGQRRTFVHRDR